MLKEFYFERFYMGLLFSVLSFLIWFFCKKITTKSKRKEKYENSNEYLSWYLNYKFYLAIKITFYFSIITLIISIVSLIQYFSI